MRDGWKTGIGNGVGGMMEMIDATNGLEMESRITLRICMLYLGKKGVNILDGEVCQIR